jgi:hypothetical protein
MWPSLVYIPVLLCSPILLVLGIFVLVVPGGFILVVAGTFVLLEVLGAAAVATVRQLLALRVKQRRGTATSPAMAPRGVLRPMQQRP